MEKCSTAASGFRRAALTIAIAMVPLVGCTVADPNANEETDSSTDALKAVATGCDYAWSRPSPGTLKGQGFSFVARYLSYDTTGKNLDASEEHSLEKHDLDIVLVWEWNADDALKGYNKGVEDAHAAQKQAFALGMPHSRPLYFAVDFDATSGQEAAIGSYFDGVAHVLGRDRTGAYAGYNVIKHLFDNHKITWGWQTYAWSGGKWDKRAQLRQVLNGIDGGDVDKDVAVKADFGQWDQHGSAT
jgi:hypothetical protein